MRLAIQIPCLNEERTLPETLRDLPRRVEGFDEVLWVIIDDGSTDSTAAVAKEHGADHVVSLCGHQGLARATMAGIDACIALGADVIISTDADNQYDARDVPALVGPILCGRADVVVGTRPISEIAHFSFTKKLLQRIGSWVVRSLSGTRVEDATSGFRAYTRDAAMQLNIFNSYTGSLETLIQAGRSNLRVACVPIRVNGPTRPSRLMRSNFHYIRRNGLAMLATYMIYRPVQVFGVLASLMLVPGAALAARYLWFMARGEGAGHVQSVIASGVLAICGFLMIGLAVLGHLLAINRRLLEDLRYQQRRAAATDRPGQPALGHTVVVREFAGASAAHRG
jgi:glycosyltransferase involved in cell wall biosynthesis